MQNHSVNLLSLAHLHQKPWHYRKSLEPIPRKEPVTAFFLENKIGLWNALQVGIDLVLSLSKGGHYIQNIIATLMQH